MSRLKTKFDKETHKAKNEKIAMRYNIKKKMKEEMFNSQASVDSNEQNIDQANAVFDEQ